MISRYFLIIFLILKVSLGFAQTSEGEIEEIKASALNILNKIEDD